MEPALMTLLAAAVASIAGGLYLILGRPVRPAKVKQMRVNPYMDEHLGI